eukprot:4685467-Prymnesium_polylepis.1
MTHRRDINAHMRANGVSRSHSTISGRHSREKFPAAVRSVKRRRAAKPSSRTVEFIDGRNVGSVS